MKQRKRLNLKGILTASNWVRENVHNLIGQTHTKKEWAEIVSDGSGHPLTSQTAVEILESCGIAIETKSAETNVVARIKQLERQVAALTQAVNGGEVVKPEAAVGCFPFARNNERMVQNANV